MVIVPKSDTKAVLQNGIVRQLKNANTPIIYTRKKAKNHAKNCTK